MQLGAVDDHEFVVIARQVVSRARYGDTGRQHTRLQLTQVPLSAAVGIGNESMDKNPPARGPRQGLFQIGAVESKNRDLYTLLSAVYGFDQRHDSVARLYEQLHVCILPLRGTHLATVIFVPNR